MPITNRDGNIPSVRESSGRPTWGRGMDLLSPRRITHPLTRQVDDLLTAALPGATGRAIPSRHAGNLIAFAIDHAMTCGFICTRAREVCGRCVEDLGLRQAHAIELPAARRDNWGSMSAANRHP
jgi:hypothetical protein